MRSWCWGSSRCSPPSPCCGNAAEASSWQRESLIEDAGWATIPGQEEPNEALAETCLVALEDALATPQEQADL